MELCYIWVEKYKNLQEKGYSFSNRYVCNFESQNLMIKDKGEQLSIYNNNIENIHLLLGENGSGKTTVLDLLGMPFEKRATINSKGYFIVYAISPTEFLIEGDNHNLIKESIKYFPVGNVSRLYSVVCTLQEGILYYKDFPGYLKNDPTYEYGYISYRYLYDESIYSRFSIQGFDIHKRHLIPRFLFQKEKKNDNFKFDGMLELGRNSKLNWLARGNLTFNLESNNFFEQLDLPVESPDLYSYRYDMFDLGKVNSMSVKEKFISHMMYSLTLKLLEGIYLTMHADYLEKWSKLVTEINEMKYLNEKKDQLHYLKIARLALDIRAENTDKDALKPCSYEEYKKIFESLEYLFEGLSETYFFDNNEIRLPLDEVSKSKLLIETVKTILFLIDTTRSDIDDFKKGLINFLQIDYVGFSTGELSIFHLYLALKNARKKLGIPIKKMIILLDEPEIHLHPEWSRKMIGLLSDLLEGEQSGHSYQVIISTHSPFLLSDVPSENVINMSGKSMGYEGTFAGNIHTLLANSFFLDSTIGEFSKGKIDEVISYILSKRTIGRNEESDVKIRIPEYMNPYYAQYIISLIAEPVLKNKLQGMYDEYVLFDLEKENQIEIYKQRIEELEK